MFERDQWDYPVATDTGVRCGNHGALQIRHANAAAVRECFRLADEERRDDEALIRAEAAIERRLEDRGYWASLG